MLKTLSALEVLYEVNDYFVFCSTHLCPLMIGLIHEGFIVNTFDLCVYFRRLYL
jgi:hypothetical protein